MLKEEQIDIRRQRARASTLQIDNLNPKKKVFSDYRVSNPDHGRQLHRHDSRLRHRRQSLHLP